MPNSRGHILIIEDEMLLALNLRDLLEKANFRCQTAHKIADALQFIKNQSFDLIFSDHDLSDGKGLDLIRQVSATKPDLRFIYMTAATKKIIDEVKNYPQVIKILQKPVSEKNILETLDQLTWEENKAITRFIGSDERKLILEIHDDV